MILFSRLINAAALAVALTLAGATAASAQTADLFTGFQSNSKDPIQIDAASLEISEEAKTRISEFAGGVVVKRGDTTMRASKIRVFSPLGDNKPKGQSFSRIEASGNVEVKSGPQTVTGSQVVVDMVKQTITMSGSVVLSQGPNVITGDRLVVDLATGKARVEQEAGKPIRGVFTPGEGGGFAPPGQ